MHECMSPPNVALVHRMQVVNAHCPRGVVFLLWGKFAQDRAQAAGIDSRRHHLLKSVHPSGLSASRVCGISGMGALWAQGWSSLCLYILMCMWLG